LNIEAALRIIDDQRQALEEALGAETNPSDQVGDPACDLGKSRPRGGALASSDAF
jgi:hypothetical protein